MSELDWSKYEAVVGKRWNYYRPRFEKFARGGWLSWNWAALFGTLAWLRYRRMYAWSWAYFFVSTPFLLAVLLIFTSASDACERALDPTPAQTGGLIVLALLALGWIVPPLMANRLYYNRIHSIAAQPDPVMSTGGIAGALALQALVLIGAAVAGPSYANYIYRSMVSEGVMLGAAAKAPIEEYVKERNRLPARIEDVAGNTSGKYVDRLVLESDGTIRATFGEKGKKLSGRSVLFVPVKKDGQITAWTCRSADLPDRCLPASCRP
jgi:type IV pilus assembly protein PilA